MTGIFLTIQSPRRTKKLPTNPAANIPIRIIETMRTITPSPGMVNGRSS